MGNCGSAKKTIVKADASKATQSALALAKNENINQNFPNTAQAIIKPDAQAKQTQQAINSALNGLSQKLKNYKIKFIAVYDSYYPNKKPEIGGSQNSIKNLPENNISQKLFSAETILKDCL